MYAVMSNSRKPLLWTSHRPRVQGFNWRTPPLRWRQWFVGALLALPGAVGGLMLALALPIELSPLLAIAGAFTGLRIGFKMENR